ncbi:MAG: YHS domain-containing protein [Nitrospirales bacterium]|nr:YHS domain-containing protein [Nitrospirales bacterium]
MKPRPVDPVCGMAYEDGFQRYASHGKDYVFCSTGCLEQFRKDPDSYKGKDGARGKHTLAFYDTKTNKPVLTVPVIFTGKGEKYAEKHHH